MNYNVIAYIIYLALVVFIIVYVGRYFYTNGKIFIISLFHGNVALADQTNRLLLLAYYLFNIGYSFLKLKQWQKLSSIEMLVSSVASNVGVLIFILAVTHYANMLLIYYLSRSKSFFLTNKPFQS